MKRIEFAGKQLKEMGIHLEKITYASTVYKIPVAEPAAALAESENQLAAAPEQQ